MKALLVASALALALACSNASFAKPAAHWTPGNCPLGNPMCAGPAAGGGSAPADIVTSLINAKGDVLRQLEAADSMDRQIIPNSSPPEMWDPIGHMCIAGIGTEGQPGYVPGLAKWIAGLTVPPKPPAAPGGTDGPVIAFTEARLAVIAGLRVTSALQTQGIPLNLRQACGGLLADINNQVLTAAAQVAAFAKLFAVLIPK